MAKQSQNTSSSKTDSFDKELNTDLNDFHLPSNAWTQARNAINNSVTGDLGKLGNEPSNKECIRTTYPIIGFVHLEADRWVVFSTNSSGTSEIGLFQESTCNYLTVVVDTLCLNFSKYHLIKGISRTTSDCVFEVYWADGLNSDRVIAVDAVNFNNNLSTNPDSPIAWVKTAVTISGCVTYTNTPQIDCQAIRVAKLITPPCVKVQNGVAGGTLANGSYIVFVAYAVSGQKISDWYQSNVQAIFSHENTSGSLDVVIESMDDRYDEFICVVVSIVNQQAVAHQAGVYSTRQTLLGFDIISTTWPSVPIEQLPLITPIADKSDAIYNVGDYAIRVGPTSKLDFNYQPLANQIVAKWVAVQYPADYYKKGGNNVGFMRDEVYPFFIRYIWDTGDKTPSFHIPGRPHLNPPLFPNELLPSAEYVPSVDSMNTVWYCENTATLIATAQNIPLPDGGIQQAEGYMAYWESTESYPDDKPQIWNANDVSHPWTAPNSAIYPGSNIGPAGDYDICGDKIRHHKFPEETLNQYTEVFNSGVGTNINILGVKFENIRPPVDNNGVPIPGIIGYEILRGSRAGNKTIIAKGIINNMGGVYSIEGNTSVLGLYPNYPYNDLTPDPFLSTNKNTKTNFTPQSSFSDTFYTFHSPDTNFTNPYLNAKELKIYGNIYGNVEGNFRYSEKHPKEKLLTDLCFFIAAVGGIGIAMLAANGKRRVKYVPPTNPGYSQAPTLFWVAAGGPPLVPVPAPVPWTPGLGGEQPEALVDAPAIALGRTAVNTANAIFDSVYGSSALLATNLLGQDASVYLNTLQSSYNATALTTSALTSARKEYETEDTAFTVLPPLLQLPGGLPLFFNYFTEGTDSILRLMRNFITYKDFVLRYDSHAFYNNYVDNMIPGQKRWGLQNQQYIGPQLVDFSPGFRINNQYRVRTVAIEITQKAGAGPSPTFINDRSRYIAGDVFDPNFKKDPTSYTITSSTPYLSINGPGNAGNQVASSHYVALKQRLENQYGQLNNIVQQVIPGCFVNNDEVSTPVMFGGDTYIGRYTEKNTFFFFYDWLYNQPDGAQLDYNVHKMILYPRYWANFNGFDTSDFTSTVFGNIIPFTPSAWLTPSDFYNLDGTTFSSFGLGVKNAYMYLFNSGVRDFFVESEINIDLRDHGNVEAELHYDPYRYTDTKALFDTNLIKVGNYYKYDISLSVSKLFTNYTSWGYMQDPQYDPTLAETCYQYRPRRMLYSLPAQFEGRRDNWLIYLANNYTDTLARVTCIKPINKSGALIFFDNMSPIQFQGLDQLQTDLGTKLTIGDGGLFSQPMQNLLNADRPYEYGSCQDRLSVANTPMGTFWISQNQGKIFQLQGGIEEISMTDIKWWFATYLPYKLTEAFPTFELIDNPVAGIGCQSIYDNENQLVYFTKKDYIIRTDLAPGINITYVSADDFMVNNMLPIKLGDPNYFEDASWTMSYDPKTKGWISWHDWHPDLLMPGKNTFLSIYNDSLLNKEGGVWLHNYLCNSYCNYYGKNYPFEVEFMINTVQTVNTVRSIEYIMEAYKYDTNCHDRFHVLDYNFDEAVIHNTEQVSGLLRLNLTPKNDPMGMINYPIVNATNIDILFAKVENKYRFNQFWDITDDRGEYNLAAQRMIWNTAANGYVRILNPNNLNYNKAPMEHKRFRHYTNSVLLRKKADNAGQPYKMLVMLATAKELYSPR